MKRTLVYIITVALLVGSLLLADTHLVARQVPLSTPTILPTLTPELVPSPEAGTGPRAVVISLGGAQAGRVADCIANGTMPNLARLKAQGAMAQYALSVDPPLAAPASASLASGAYPAETGVVSDRFHSAPDDLDRPTVALRQGVMLAEPVWRTAMRDARRTAAICWPGTDVESPATLADYTVTYGDLDTASAQHQVTFTQALTWTSAPRSFSPPREGQITVRRNGQPMAVVHVLAVDTSDDDQANYDTFILDRERQVTAASATLRLGQAAPLVVDERLVSGAYFGLTQVAADHITIYQSPVYYNRAQPDELVREVNRRFGFFPPEPDYGALQQGWITPEQYVQMAAVQSHWIVSVTSYVLETYHPELLCAWLGPAEQLGQAFLLTDPRQPNYSPERAAEYAQYLRRGYALADDAVGQLARGLDLGQVALMVVSDHGLAPARSQVGVNTLLYNTKLGGQRLLLYEQGTGGTQVDLSLSRALGVAAGAAAHIYINLQGRERAGTVPAEAYQAVQDAIVAAFQGAKDKDGQPIFSRVVRQADLEALGLNSADAGDVFVQAAPGYSLIDGHVGDIAGPPAWPGQAGLPATTPEMQAVFLAAGRGIRAGVEVGPVHILDLAPTLDHLLGLQAPATLAGRVLDEVLVP